MHWSTTAQFRRLMLAQESGINPDKLDWYQSNWNVAVVPYYAVHSPGKIAREVSDGAPIRKQLTVSEYFDAIGVAMSREDICYELLRQSQYKAINPWGFIGYQLGEAVLIDCGFYKPVVRRVDLGDNNIAEVPSYYIGPLDQHLWAGGTEAAIITDERSGKAMLATHVNQWHGTFQNFHRLNGVRDFRTETIQEKIFEAVSANNILKITKFAEDAGTSIEALIAYAGRLDEFKYTMSGLVAASHLGGAVGAFNFLANRADASDETGTPISKYFRMFSGMDV